MIQDCGYSDSSQLRQVFVFFLEELLPNHLSKASFKLLFLDAYFSLSEDPVPTLLLSFVHMAVSGVRLKLDDIKSIERLHQSLDSIEKRFKTTNKKELLQAIAEAKSQIKDQKYLQQVQLHQ